MQSMDQPRKRPAACSVARRDDASKKIRATVEKPLSDRRLKQYSAKGSSKEFIPMSVGLTGARAGDLLQGIASESSGDTANVTLRIVSGVVGAPGIIRRSVEAEVGRDKLIASVAHHFNVSRAVAELRYADFPTLEAPNHQPLGSGCSHSIEEDCECEPAATFQILSQGAWQEFADAHGHGDELRKMVEEQRTVCWRDVLKLMFISGQPDGKKLLLRPRLFQIVIGPTEVSLSDPRLVDPSYQHSLIDARIFGTSMDDVSDAGVVYDVEGYLIRLMKPGDQQFSKELVTQAVMEALQGLVPKDSLQVERVQQCVDILRVLSSGGLKSCLQKAIRFRASFVDFGGSLGHMHTAVVAAVVGALIFAERGSFSPELQIFTRGCTAVLKRTAIILLEDAWVESPDNIIEHNVLALMATAFATRHITGYEPPYVCIVATLRLIARAALSPSVIAWRLGDRIDKKAEVPAASQASLRQAAKLLRLVRSFGGDMDMFDTVATMAESGSISLVHSEHQPTMMPLCHLVDQHTYRGVAHPLRCSVASFVERFRMIFDRCTGFNPRRQDLEAFKQDTMVPHIRFAQECCLMFVLRERRHFLPPLDLPYVDLFMPLDTGVLAAAVGPVAAQVGEARHRREVLVLLGINAPEEETVMLKPTRATKDLFKTLSEKERAEAIKIVRGRSFVVTSPLLQGSRKVEFTDSAWHIDARRWSDVVAEGRKFQVPLVDAPTWALGPSPNFEAALQNDEALREALTSEGEGIAVNAQQSIISLVRTATYSVALRALGVLRKQCAKLELPTPALDGGLGSDQMAAYDGDWDAYRLLALISRLVPGAFRPETPPNFTVSNVPLLRVLEGWILLGTQAAQACTQRNGWVNHRLWQHMEGVQHRLMEHQRAAIARMNDRDAGASCGHFLIMDTGHGKTVTSLVYAHRWLSEHGHSVRRILWITPAGTVTNLAKQLEETWTVPVFEVPRLSSAKTVKEGNTSSLILKDFHVNVIHADHLRTAISKGLAEEAAFSFIIFDEVDEMYAPTLRTSAARRLCQLCPKFVAQTATPLRRNESQLITWLSDTCAFPVNHANWLVAASGMVSIQLELGIASIEEDVLIPMNDEVRKTCTALHKSRSWLDMARVVQAATDDAMCKLAVSLAIKDRTKHKQGGVLLVADNLQHAENLIALCSKCGSKVGGFSCLEVADTEKYEIVVVTKHNDRGYNSAVRLGAMVTGAYAGNGSARHQIRGRLRRMGQKRDEVRFVTVVMENSLLHLLHQRHSTVDCMNISLEQLGQQFCAEVLDGLKK